MREYLRLQRRCEELEERLALRREETQEEIDADQTNWARRAFLLSPQQAKVLLAVLANKRPGVTSAKLNAMIGLDGQSHTPSVLVFNVNKRIRALGGPERAIHAGQGRGSIGYFADPKLRAWCEERAPHIFQRGPSA